MIDTFFNDLNLPDFLSPYFNKEDFYSVIGEFIDLIQCNFTDSPEFSTFRAKASVEGKVMVGENVRIGQNVVIHGPVFIGNNVEIAPFSYIRPGAIICDNVVVGSFSVIKNSLMMSGSKTGDYAYLGDSILGQNARMGATASTLNRRFDQGLVSFAYEDKKLETQFDKLGAIIGDDSRVGGGTVIYPGTMIGRNSFISPNLSIKGFIPSNKYVKQVDYAVKQLNNKFSGKLHNKSKHY